ncbi:pleckstrin homology domain-containing family M member 2 [Ischnura elegans]|uniref:pleckstrin homology domain-containing family M member 2 n=1 Tax=Ischnura elegans TaxID=197161 RepID=UPI001ED873A7|nr:pleckstrin homology domain-containing family M member 2 [Ischnura elegans]
MSSYMLSCKASVINWSNAFREQSRKLESAMDSSEDKNGVKERILDELGKAVKLVQYHALSSSGAPVQLGSESWVVQGLCRWVDRALLHGLRRLQAGYWPIMRVLAHSDTINAIETLSHIDSPVGLGRAWLHMALTEGTLESYIGALVREGGDCPREELEESRCLLRKHYTPRALLRDPLRASRFLAALFPIRSAHFCLELDVSYFEVSCFVPGAVVGIGGFMGASWEQPFSSTEQGSGGCNTPMTSSLTSSTLPSPGDSGVALLTEGDDADATEDDSSYSEIEDNRINRMLSMEMECKNEPESVCSTPDTKVKKNEESDFIPEENEYNTVEVIRSKVTNKVGYSPSLPRPCGDILLGESGSLDEAEGFDDQSPSPTTGMYSESLVTMMPKSPTMTDSGIQAESPQNEVITTPWILEENRDLNQVEEPTPVEQCEPREPSAVILRKSARRKDAPVKRVSFHEDLQDAAGTSEVAAELNVRHSWCSGADVNLNDWSSDGAEVNLARYCFTKSSQLVTPVKNETKDVVLQGSVPPVTERGVPEGQEDPPSACRSPYKQANRNLSCSETNIAKHLAVTSMSSKAISPSVHLRGKPVAAVRPRRRCDGLSRIGSLQKLETMESCDSKAENKDAKVWQWWPPLIVNSASVDYSEISKAVDLDLAEEIEQGLREKPALAAGDCPWRVKELLEKEVLQIEGDQVYKVFKVRSSFSVKTAQSSKRACGSPLLVVLSTRGVYLVGSLGDLKLHPGSWLAQKGAATYEKRFEILYDDLDTVVVGPNYQSLTMCTRAKNKVKATQRLKHFCITVGDKDVTMDIVSHLEFAMRRWNQSSLKKALNLRQKQSVSTKPWPAIAVLGLDKLSSYLASLQPKGHDSEALKRMIGLLEGEPNFSKSPFKVLHYGLVHVEDEHPATPPCTPLGPTRRGHLMFHAHSILPGPSGSSPGWQPAYFLLKAGVLYKFDDALSRLPSWAIPLEGGQPSGPHGWECQGFRRILDEPRPHTFEVLLGRGRSLRLAAADEYEASDWLQAFVQSASSGISVCSDGLVGDVEGPFVQPCSVMLTDNGQVLICQEEDVTERSRKKVMGHFQTVSMAYLSDVTSLRMAPDGAGFWCALEFDCREVHERGGDWILHFPSLNEMQIFLQTLKDIWENLNFQEPLPLSVADEDELVSRCAHSSRHLASSWDTLLLSPHGSRDLEEVRVELMLR